MNKTITKKKNSEGQETTKPQIDVKKKEESPEANLPEFPPEEGDISTGSPMEESEEKISSPELEEICGNIMVVLFQIWGIIQKGIEPLKESEKKLISPSMARLAVKYHVDEVMNDEIMFLGILGFSVSKRVLEQKKKAKKDDSYDSGEKGKRQDEPSETIRS